MRAKSHLTVQLQVSEGLGHDLIRQPGELDELAGVRRQPLPRLPGVGAGGHQRIFDALIVWQLV